MNESQERREELQNRNISSDAGFRFHIMKRGELPIQILSSYNPDTGILTNSTMQNPGIFVPELRKIVYGCGSWWREIKSVDELKAITDEDIENTWYVQLLQNM